ncbi:MAG: hypothetical protein AVDCRST_MAG11-1689, partial [uncultured Gemmatimonadaceae bacterium]
GVRRTPRGTHDGGPRGRARARRGAGAHRGVGHPRGGAARGRAARPERDAPLRLRERPRARRDRALPGLVRGPGAHGARRVQRRPARARRRAGGRGRVPRHRRVPRGHHRELGVGVPADGGVRPPHRVPLPARLVGVQGDRGAGGGGPASGGGARRPRGALARAARRRRARSLQALAEPRAGAAVRRVVRAARGGGRGGVQRGAAAARRRAGVGARLPRDEPVLVRVVPELAERVPLGGGARAALDLAARAGVAAVEAGGGGVRRDGGV